MANDLESIKPDSGQLIPQLPADRGKGNAAFAGQTARSSIRTGSPRPATNACRPVMSHETT
jgi:hypothetical protein